VTTDWTPATMGAKGGHAGLGKPKPRGVAATAKARGAKGGAATGASKRRSVDYAALGRKGAEARRLKREE
jgi:hypothetical protein